MAAKEANAGSRVIPERSVSPLRAGLVAAARVFALAVPCAVLAAGCYSAGNGTAPPTNQFYFPVGLAVSNGGSVLYAVNSDFDLQYNGGTLQSYDLQLIRKHALLEIADPNDPNLPLVRPAEGADDPCPGMPPLYASDGSGLRQPLGQTCAPPVDSSFYERGSAIIGAFATDLQLSTCEKAPQTHADLFAPVVPCDQTGIRLYSPVRGDASLTWADVAPDDPNAIVSDDPNAKYAPFNIGCGQADNDGRCDAVHHAGNNPNELYNTRNITMPGEPFGMAQSEDGQSIVITHQDDTESSLFLTGLVEGQRNDPYDYPSLQFVLQGVPAGGTGLAAVPHDLALGCAPGDPCTPPPPRPAFVETNRTIAELDLLRYYPDDFTGTTPNPATTTHATLTRPFLVRESDVALTVNASGIDSRGIAIDPTPRLACKARVRANPPANQADFEAAMVQCAELPARLFVANRSPDSLLIGEIGDPAGEDGTYNADRITINSAIPLSTGSSRIYLAPIVDVDGTFALRVFIVCFDSATIYVYDPDAQRMENVLRVAIGPFAMAFDPFSMEDVAAHAKVQPDPRAPGTPLLRYRFAYVASFTDSFVELLDLDNSQPDKSTFETAVFTLGNPTPPKGS